MQIKEITEKEIWESFLAKQKEKTFFQSWNWGEFHKKMGEKVWRLGVYDSNELVGIVCAVRVQAKRGTFLVVEHGPAFAKASAGKPVTKKQILEALLEKLKEIAKEEGASFIRMSPIWERSEENRKVYADLGFREAPMYAAAESSWKLDITRSEEELLEQMRKTTRYLIRQTLKNENIEVTKSSEINDLTIFEKLNEEVGRRQEFVPFSSTYATNEFEVFAEDDGALLLFGKYKGEVVAAAFVIFWSGIAFYHQAASLSKYAKYSIPYLLQWEAIKEAKQRGCTLYDFWGYVDPKKYPKHPWAGPTLFKMGFGGEAYEYVKNAGLSVIMEVLAHSYF